MADGNGNYSAFYVNEPFNENGIFASSTKDYESYNMLKAWKEENISFPFIDSHEKNYNVRDGSDLEEVLKPRIHERLNNSKNIILFLSYKTKNSIALQEEIDFGINTLGLPVIVIYPEYSEKSDIIYPGSKVLKNIIKELWDRLPVFKDSMKNVPTIHLPLKKELIKKTLQDPDFMVNTKCYSKIFFYTN